MKFIYNYSNTHKFKSHKLNCNRTVQNKISKCSRGRFRTSLTYFCESIVDENNYRNLKMRKKWLPRSCDLNDYFLWSYLRSNKV